jgi:serine/threonine-protein kinase
VKLGLLGRALAGLAVVGLAPLLIVPYLVTLNRDAMTEQVLSLHAVAAQSSAARVVAFLDPLRSAGQAAAANPLVTDDPRSDQAQAVLKALMQAQPAIGALGLANTRGEPVVRVQDPKAAEAAEALLAEPTAAPLVFRRLGSQLWLRLEVPLPDGRGLVRVVADASALRAAARPQELGEQALLAIASRAPELVIAWDSATTLDAFPPGLVRAAAAGVLSGSGRYPAGDGSRVLGAFAPVADTDWYVISAQPAAVAEATARRMQRRSLVAVGAALLLAGAAGGLAFYQVIRPVRELAEAQRRLARDAHAPRSGNEIEDLRASFAALELQAKDREAVGQVFLGRYQVLEPIGSGGMGTVFKGWDPKLQRYVALKTVHLDASLPRESPGAQVSSLLSEAVTVARFSHPNIVAIYDVEDIGDAAFIAIELIDGRSLERYLSHAGALSVAESVPLGAALARGLAAAHAQGVVHRDMKPANVLLGRDGSIKVADFGIAAALSRLAEQADMIFGTPGYIAPESIRGEPQGIPGDLFALGVVLYESLSGAMPFEATSVDEVLDATLRYRPRPLSGYNAEVPPDVDALVMGLLEKDPVRRRPQSAAEIADQLETLAFAQGWRWQPVFPSEEVFASLPASTFSRALRVSRLNTATEGRLRVPEGP